ncbi:hypothetical protein [Bradyrhizobium sp. ORS 285]|uniref:hypothetical protein n=1 Tax=Bradyrhizobium sp. ORS 285 TaxID=115808 RepID=UPI0002DF3009|nr:hypothetical protein [Bradyrhizobium sp. ORS 285]
MDLTEAEAEALLEIGVIERDGDAPAAKKAKKSAKKGDEDAPAEPSAGLPDEDSEDKATDVTPEVADPSKDL